MNIRERLGKELLFLDGGMGTLLQAEGLAPGELPETWNIEHPEKVEAIHRRYYEAGSDVVLANTFGANVCKFHDDRYTVEEVIRAGIANAKRAGSSFELPALFIRFTFCEASDCERRSRRSAHSRRRSRPTS